MKIWAPLSLSLVMPLCSEDAPPTSATSSHTPTCDAKGTISAHPDMSTLCTGDAAAFIGSTSYDLVQDAIDDATSGDTLYLCPKTHAERLNVETLNIDLAAASGDPTDTILSGESAFQILNINKAEMTLYNLSFLDGRGAIGAAIIAENAELALECVTLADNTATTTGGAIDFSTGSLSIRYSTFTDNAASEDGGAIRWGGSLDSSITIDTSLFAGNTASEDGGALHLGDKAFFDSVQISDARFAENSASGGGGAIAMEMTKAMEVLIEGTTFEANTADDVGGGILVSGGGEEYDIWIDGCSFEANVAPSGAAIEVSDDPAYVDLDIYVSSILDNESDDGAAVRTSSDSILWSYSTDWGVRGDPLDNEGDDLSSKCGDYDALQSAETFLCAIDGTWSTP